MVNTVHHPIDTVMAAGAAQDALRQKAEDAFKNGRYAEGVRHVLNYLVPVAGPAIDAQGDQAQRGEVAKALGGATALGLQLAGPEALSRVVPASATPQPSPSTVARNLYQTSLKVRRGTPRAEVAELVSTGLQNEIPVTEAGAQKLSALLDNYQQVLDAKTNAAAQSGVTVDPLKVAARADEVEKRVGMQVNPDKDLRSVRSSQDEFLKNNPNPIPADQAQAMKVGTYQKLKGKYGEQAPDAEVEAQKALARGLKEELSNAIPELTDLNDKEAKLINLQPVIEKTLNDMATKPAGPGLKGWVAAGVANSVFKDPSLAAAAGLMERLISDPTVRSRLAIAINKAQQKNPAKWGAPSLRNAFARVDQVAAAMSGNQPQQ